jgi:hypothetical protein
LKDYRNYCVQKIVLALKNTSKQVGLENSAILFEEIWGLLNTDQDLKLALLKIEKPPFRIFRLNANESLHLLIIMVMRELGINCIPKIILHDDIHIKSAIESNTSSMFVGVHNGFAFIAAILYQYGQRSSAISSDPFISKTLWLNGLRPDLIELITNDFRCLARLRLSMAQGIVPTNFVDFLADDEVFRYINPTLFAFAIQQNLKIYFAKRQIREDGAVYIETKELESSFDPIVDANLLIDFEKSNVYSPERVYEVRKM